MNKQILLLVSLTMILFFSCQKKSQPPIQETEKIIFDTDMGSDCDDAGALALLHAYADMGQAEILGCIYSSGKVPYGAGIVQSINIRYGRRDIPIGATHENQVGDSIDKMSAEKLAKDTAAFHNTIIRNRDAQEQTLLNRKLLAGQEDNSVTYLTVGHTKGLYDLLTSQPDDISPLTGSELVRKKIKRWVALGALGARNEENHFTKDWNFFFNGTAPYTKYLVENFPAPVYYIDAGSNVMTGKSLKHTSPGNIVRTAYRDWLWRYGRNTLDDQRPSWDLTAVYFAVKGSGIYLKHEGKGWLEFDVNKGCRWHDEGTDKVHQTYISQRKDVSERFASYLNRLIAKDPKLNEK